MKRVGDFVDDMSLSDHKKRKIKEALSVLGWEEEDDVDESFLMLDKDQLQDKGGLLARDANFVLAKIKQLPDLQVADPDVCKFWEQLSSADVSEENSVAFLRLEDGTKFLGMPTLGDTLMVRECYDRLDEIIKELFAHGQQAVAVIGNPGIGKSMLGYLLLYKWSCEGRRVVVLKRAFMSRQPLLLCKDGAFKLDDKGLEKELANPDVMYLVDGVNPIEHGLPKSAKMVLLTSPDRDIFWETFKMNCYTTLYMDVWSLDELKSCRRAMYPTMAEEDMIERYDKWGGIPRYVLEKTKHVDQKALQDAISSSKLEDIQSSLGGTFAGGNVSNRILHLRASENFEDTYMQMASPWVAERVAYHLWEQQRAQLQQFIGASAGMGPLGGVRGNLWEGFCHWRLAEGGDFRIRDLSTAASPASTIHLPTSTGRTVFNACSEVKDEAEGRPRVSNKAAIDSAKQPKQLFQITVSPKHGIHCAGLRKAVEAMSSTSSVSLYFVLPPDQFPAFTQQRIRKRAGAAKLRQLVKQYALELGF